MNKSPKARGLDSFVQAHKRSPRVFMKILIFLEVKRSFIRGVEKWGSYVLMWNMLEEQVSMMETWKNP